MPDKYQLRVGSTLDPWQGSTVAILLGVVLGSPRKIHYKGFLTQIGHSVLNHKTYHPGNMTRLYGAQNSIQKLQPCLRYKQFCACWLYCPSAAGVVVSYSSVWSLQWPPNTHLSASPASTSAIAGQLTPRMPWTETRREGPAVCLLTRQYQVPLWAGCLTGCWTDMEAEFWPHSHPWSSWQGRVQQPVAKRQAFPDSEIATWELWLWLPAYGIDGRQIDRKLSKFLWNLVQPKKPQLDW